MVALNPTLTEAAVRDLARPQSYDRGENYYDEGAVVEISRRGETLRAAVEGSQYEPYQVRIDLDETGVVDTACSCPYDHGGICKHRVAVLLTYVCDPDSKRPNPETATHTTARPRSTGSRSASRCSTSFVPRTGNPPTRTTRMRPSRPTSRNCGTSSTKRGSLSTPATARQHWTSSNRSPTS